MDVLRAIAVLCVVAAHFGDIALGVTDQHPVIYLGSVGVMLFFVHTSYVLMLSLDRLRSRRWIRDFYVRRAFRIYPLAIVTVVLTVLLRVPIVGLQPRPSDTVGELLSNLLLIQNLTHSVSRPPVLWSLPREVQMYLVLPFFWIAARHRYGVALILLWLAIVARLVATDTGGTFDLLAYVPCFLAGALSYRLAWNARRVVPAWAWPIVIAGIVAASVIMQVAFARREPYAMLAHYATCLALGVALPYVRDLSASIITRAAREIAKYSYGVYLVHVGVLSTVFGRLDAWSPIAKWATCIVAIALLSVAMYHAIEAPMIRLGKRLTAGTTVPTDSPLMVGAP